MNICHSSCVLIIECIVVNKNWRHYSLPISFDMYIAVFVHKSTLDHMSFKCIGLINNSNKLENICIPHSLERSVEMWCSILYSLRLTIYTQLNYVVGNVDFKIIYQCSVERDSTFTLSSSCIWHFSLSKVDHAHHLTKKWNTLMLIIVVSTAFNLEILTSYHFQMSKTMMDFYHSWCVSEEWHLAALRTNEWSLKSTKPPKNISRYTCKQFGWNIENVQGGHCVRPRRKVFHVACVTMKWMTWCTLFGMKRHSHESIRHLYSACGLRGIALHGNHPQIQITFSIISIYESQQWRETFI